MRKLIWLFDVTILKTVIVVWGKHRSLSSVCCYESNDWTDILERFLPKVPISWHISPLSVIRTCCFLFSELDSGCVAMGLCNACVPTLSWPCMSTALAQLLCNTYPEGGMASGEAPKWECVHTLGWRPRRGLSQWGKQANHIPEQPVTPNGSEWGQQVNFTQHRSCSNLTCSVLTDGPHAISKVTILSILKIQEPGTCANDCGTLSSRPYDKTQEDTRIWSGDPISNNSPSVIGSPTLWV